MTFAIVTSATAAAAVAAAALAGPALARSPEIEVRHAVARVVVIVEDRPTPASRARGPRSRSVAWAGSMSPMRR